MKRMVAGISWLVFIIGMLLFTLSLMIEILSTGLVLLVIIGYIVAALPGTTLIRYGRRAMRKEKDAMQARINILQAQSEVK